ncbi:hypothetical protein [Streptomyces goshikiensis]|nr:hypothetical protein [Streptomyces goshikiensis]WBY25006.1 hypothetical protein PET44_35860 [Streptomyces goshikiensis]
MRPDWTVVGGDRALVALVEVLTHSPEQGAFLEDGYASPVDSYG